MMVKIWGIGMTTNILACFGIGHLFLWRPGFTDLQQGWKTTSQGNDRTQTKLLLCTDPGACI